jgi:hypothetical protein
MESNFELRWHKKEHGLGFQCAQTKFIARGPWLLPRDTAPCLTFDMVQEMPAVWEVFGPAAHWSSSDRLRLSGYRVLGSDGAGNPICVESDSGLVWLLDHEDHFKTRQFVNTSVPLLAECLLAYLGETSQARFQAAVSAIDPKAIGHKSFWWHAIQTMELV